mmetsp:Transcript_69113/g.192363  ORF Transcript_69113/g.192363 Transcript_69113/m.192363 type:complete len:265 (+) Transcript_69113:151-945(+)
MGCIFRASSNRSRSSKASFTPRASACGQIKTHGACSQSAGEGLGFAVGAKASRSRAHRRSTRRWFSARREFARLTRVSKYPRSTTKLPSIARGTSRRKARVRSCTITRRRPRLKPLSRMPTSRAASKIRCAVSWSAHSACNRKGSSKNVVSVPVPPPSASPQWRRRPDSIESHGSSAPASASWLHTSHSPPLELEGSSEPRKTAIRPLQEDVVTTDVCAFSHDSRPRIGASSEPFGLLSSDASICCLRRRNSALGPLEESRLPG